MIGAVEQIRALGWAVQRKILVLRRACIAVTRTVKVNGTVAATSAVPVVTAHARTFRSVGEGGGAAGGGVGPGSAVVRRGAVS